MWIIDYKSYPAWVLVGDIVGWGSLVCFAVHYFTCGG